MSSALPLRSFTDYRAFLLAYAQDMKSRQATWTYGVWAKKLGLKTTSSITKILSGERDPGPQITEQLVRYFGFKDRDARYFRDLVQLKKIKQDARLSVLLMERMQKEFPDGSVRLLDDRTFSVIANWYYLPLREMTRMQGFVEDADQLAKLLRFKVTARDITRAIEALVELGLLTRDSSGRLKIAQGRVLTSNDISSEAIKRYHEQMLENAKSAVRQVEVKEREITGSTLVMRAANLAEAKEMIREFKTRFAQKFEEDAGDSVYQIQIQLFPLTKSSTQKESSS
jgi:uncharacterized protein (TIGR02147 family)